jgi:hypothetical protein
MLAQHAKPAGRRRRLQFSLRSLFVVTTLAALLLGLRNWQVQRYWRAVQTIRRLGGRFISGPESPAAELLRPLFFPLVALVDLEGRPVTNEDLKPLAALSGLEQLNLDRTKIAPGGLAPLAGLTNLTSLSLAGTAIGDADLVSLHRLRKLRTLHLEDTGVGDAGMAHLESLAALDSLTVHGSKVTGAGLGPLCGLPKLRQLWLDQCQITPATVEWLKQMRALKRLAIRVPLGAGKGAWELLSPVKSLQAVGYERSESRIIWVTSVAWDDTVAGVLEGIGRLVPLTPEQQIVLLDALSETSLDGIWKAGGGLADPIHEESPTPVIPEKERIRSVDQLLQALKQADRRTVNDGLGKTRGDSLGPVWLQDYNFARARLFAASGRAQSVVPALLELVHKHQMNNADSWPYEKALFLLIRIAGTDSRVVAALGQILQSKDDGLRTATIHAFNDDRFVYACGRIGPRITAAQADVLVPLLLSCAKDPYWEVRMGVIDALASIVPAHPKHARAAVPVLCDMLPAQSVHTLQRIAEACPDQATVILARVLANVKDKGLWESSLTSRGTTCLVPSQAVEILYAIAATNRQTAEAAIPVLARALRELNDDSRWCLEPALCRVVRKYPQHLKTILPVILAMLEGPAGERRKVGTAALAAVATGVWQRNKDRLSEASASKK